MTLSPQSRLGPYEILAPLGSGGMGEVYRARDTRLDRLVAVKVLPSHLSADPERRQRFEREARAVSSLNHPHICALYDVGEADGAAYLVMQYLDGESLDVRLAKGPLPLEQALRYAVDDPYVRLVRDHEIDIVESEPRVRDRFLRRVGHRFHRELEHFAPSHADEMHPPLDGVGGCR